MSTTYVGAKTLVDDNRKTEIQYFKQSTRRIYVADKANHKLQKFTIKQTTNYKSLRLMETLFLLSAILNVCANQWV